MCRIFSYSEFGNLVARAAKGLQQIGVGPGVIGIPDEYRGQTPKAFITLKPGAAAFTLDELKAFLKDRIGKHEMIGAMDIRAELPKTPVGKLSKKALVDEEAEKRKSATA